MNAADTNASSAMADCTPLTVVSRSLTTAEIETFISDVSTTSTNIAIASRRASREIPTIASVVDRGDAGQGCVHHLRTGARPVVRNRPRWDAPRDGRHA